MSSSGDASTRKQIVGSTVITALPFVVVFVAFLVLLGPIQLRAASDDLAHGMEIQQMGVGGWVLWRAQTWQPRLASDTAFALLLPHLKTWKVLTAAIMSLLLWVITRTALFGDDSPMLTSSAGRPAGQQLSRQTLGSYRNRVLTLGVFVCLFLFLIHPNVITSGTVWFTGSFYYLWPVTAMLLGLAPFLLAIYSKRLPWAALTPVCMLFTLCAGFTEQTAAVQIGVAGLVLVWLIAKRLRVGAALIAHFLVMVAVGAAFLVLDFTSARVTGGDELSLFPAFAGFSVLDKVMLGVNVYTTHLLHGSNILFLALAGFAGWLTFRRSTRRVVRILAWLPAAWALVNTVMLPWGYTASAARMIPHPGALGVGVKGWLSYLSGMPPLTRAPSAGAVILSLAALAGVLSVFWLLYAALPDIRDRYLVIVAYLAALVSGILIGFSATVWASESRPNYLSNILMLVVLAVLVRSTMKRVPDDSGEVSPEVGPAVGDPSGWTLRTSVPARVILVLLVAFVVYVFYLYLTVFATNTYWWY